MITIIIAAVHLLVALIVVSMTQSPSKFALLFLLIIIVSSYQYFYRWHVVRTLSKSILELHINSSGDWSVITSVAKHNNIIPLDSSFSSQYLIVINFNVHKENKYTLLITKDMTTESEFRRLRVRLKIKQ
ncbi:MAG: hypothetical protein KAG34_01595 [Cocleimonas sp.]|nr:hypothetical protein [Cocleimonas sp.]